MDLKRVQLVLQGADQSGYWRLPKLGWFSICYNALVKGYSRGIAITRHDHVFTSSRRIQDGSEVELAEAKVVRWCLQVSKSLGLSRVVVESDYCGLIQNLKSNDLPRSVLGNLIALIVELSYKYQMCRWSFIRRSANKTADWLCHWLPLEFVFV